MLVCMTHTGIADSVTVDGLQRLQGWAEAQSTPQQLALRCRLVLGAAAGLSDLKIAETLAVNRHTIALWRTRVCQQGVGAVRGDCRRTRPAAAVRPRQTGARDHGHQAAPV